METLEQITQPQRDRIARVQRYDALIGRQKQLEITISRLEALNVNLDALRQIHTLSGDVPRDLLTSGSSTLGFSVARGNNVRDVLMSVSGGAIALAERKAYERNAELLKAREALADVEQELGLLR